MLFNAAQWMRVVLADAGGVVMYFLLRHRRWLMLYEVLQHVFVGKGNEYPAGKCRASR